MSDSFQIPLTVQLSSIQVNSTSGKKRQENSTKNLHVKGELRHNLGDRDEAALTKGGNEEIQKGWSTKGFLLGAPIMARKSDDFFVGGQFVFSQFLWEKVWGKQMMWKM